MFGFGESRRKKGLEGKLEELSQESWALWGHLYRHYKGKADFSKDLVVEIMDRLAVMPYLCTNTAIEMDHIELLKWFQDRFDVEITGIVQRLQRVRQEHVSTFKARLAKMTDSLMEQTVVLEEDIELVATTAGCSEEQAKTALETKGGDIAEAIESLEESSGETQDIQG